MYYNNVAMITHTEQETVDLGYKLGKLLHKGDFIALKGDLAGGKTTFTKGIGKALNVDSVINSPTFTILKVHKGDITLYHIDAYRLEGNEYDLGLDELAEEGIMVVEWPEYYETYLPKEYIQITFKYIDDNSREINIISVGDKYSKIVEEMQ